MKQRRSTTFSARFGPATHPDHHLWRNGRRWWIAFTFHTADHRKGRVRRSLDTCDLGEARVRRDAFLARFAAQPGRTLSLRYGAAGEPAPLLCCEGAA